VFVYMYTEPEILVQYTLDDDAILQWWHLSIRVNTDEIHLSVYLKSKHCKGSVRSKKCLDQYQFVVRWNTFRTSLSPFQITV